MVSASRGVIPLEVEFRSPLKRMGTLGFVYRLAVSLCVLEVGVVLWEATNLGSRDHTRDPVKETQGVVVHLWVSSCWMSLGVRTQRCQGRRLILVGIIVWASGFKPWTPLVGIETRWESVWASRLSIEVRSTGLSG